MNVIIISDSEGKANQTVRRILDRYANRIGNNTWESAISEEGLATVHSLLRQKRSRLMRVTCHRISYHGRRHVMWSIGNRERLSPEGHLSTGWTQRNLHPADDNDPPNLRLLTRIVSLAGLCHDLGKASVAFQKKLRGDTTEEAFRHEWMSIEILATLILHPSKKTGHRWDFPDNDLAGIQCLQTFVNNPDRHTQLSTLLKKAANAQFNPPDTIILNTNTLQRTPVLSALLWLIMSHHQLPSGTNSCSLPNSKADQYRKQGIAPKDCFTLYDGGCPWQNDAWLKRFREDLQSLQTLIENQTGTCDLDHIRLYGRLALQIADHGVSSWAKPDLRQNMTLCYANTASMSSERRILAQQLPRHLLDVSRHAVRAVALLLNLPQHLPAIETDALPPSFRRAAPAAYAWQNQAVKALKAHRHHVQHSAFFGVLIAGTGSGKTFAAPRLLSVLREQLRLTYTSPTRTLTLQAGDRLRSIGFQTDQFATVIGDNTIRRLYELNTDADNNQTLDYSEEEADDEWPVILGDGITPEDFAQQFPLLSNLNTHQRTLLCAPVLSATLDTLMKMADARRGSHILHGMRLCSSDLIIDEVDHYSPEDLIAIGRLLEHAGFWQVNVMISSATLPPPVAEGLFRAWHAGLQHRTQLDGQPATTCLTGWFSNQCDALIKRIATPDNFQQAHDTFVKNLINNLDDEPIKRRIDKNNGFIKLNSTSYKNMMEPLHQAIQQLHGAHYFIDVLTQKYVSVGCLQVVNVRDCQDIALALATQKNPEDITLKIVCLHARMSLAMRNTLEQRLNRFLSRHNGDGAILTDSAIREAVSSAPTSNVVIMIVSTMESTGRDHDFDWGILETRQHSTIIQFAGRIRRHRPANHDETANLMLFNTPLRYWRLDKTDQENGIAAYTLFGVNDPIRPEFKAPPLKVMGTARFNDGLPTIFKHINDKYIINNASAIDHAHAISEKNSSCIRDVEHHRLHIALVQKSSENPERGLGGWLAANPLLRLLKCHPTEYRFRRTDSAEYLIWQEDDQWKALRNAPNQNSTINIVKPDTDVMKADPTHWLYHDTDIEVITHLAEQLKMPIRDAYKNLGQIRVRINPENSEKWRYCPQLGLLTHHNT